MTTTERISLPGFRSEMRDIRGVCLHAWTGGDSQGTPVVLWHGLPALIWSADHPAERSPTVVTS